MQSVVDLKVAMLCMAIVKKKGVENINNWGKHRKIAQWYPEMSLN